MVEIGDATQLFHRPCESNPNPAISEAVTNILHSSDLTSLSTMARQGVTSCKSKEKRVKRPMNAFMLYAQVARRKVATKYPNLNYAKLSKTLGKIWQVLPEEERRPFIEEAERLRNQHKLEHPDYKYAPKRLKSRRHQNSVKKAKFENLKPEELFSILKNESICDSVHGSSDYIPANYDTSFLMYSSGNRMSTFHETPSLHSTPEIASRHHFGSFPKRENNYDPTISLDSDNKFYVPQYSQSVDEQAFNYPNPTLNYLTSSFNRNHIPLSEYLATTKDDASGMFPPFSTTFGESFSHSKCTEPIDNVLSAFHGKSQLTEFSTI